MWPSTRRVRPPSRSRRPGTAPSPGPMKVEDSKLRTVLGIRQVNFMPGAERLAVIDTPLAG